MKLSPLDIKKQEFKRVLRGYDPIEVETFLEMIADEFEKLTTEIAEYKKNDEELKRKLSDFQRIESNLKESLVSAQEESKKSKQHSLAEGNMILKEAKFQAEKIISRAKAEIKSLEEEIVSLKSQKNVFATRLRHMLESQVELIKILESDDLELKPVQKQPRKIPVAQKKESSDRQKAQETLRKEIDKIKQVQQSAQPVKEKQEPQKPVIPKKHISKPPDPDKKDKKIIDGFDLIDKIIDDN